MIKNEISGLTNRQLRDLLPKVLEDIGALHRDRPDLVVAAWPEVIGEKLGPMTRATSFEQGILYVKVRYSTLYSLLVQHERERLLRSLREKFPSIKIRNIHFAVG